jgi:hypothetical protein
MSPFSAFQCIAPSGQNIVHIKHFVHFAVSLSGLKVFQSPVKYVTLDFQHTPAGEASFQLFSFVIQIPLSGDLLQK